MTHSAGNLCIGSRCLWTSLKYLLIMHSTKDPLAYRDIPESKIFISSEICTCIYLKVWQKNCLETEGTFSVRGSSTFLGFLELTVKHWY